VNDIRRGNAHIVSRWEAMPADHIESVAVLRGIRQTDFPLDAELTSIPTSNGLIQTFTRGSS
jgi:hypothetical protein